MSKLIHWHTHTEFEKEDIGYKYAPSESHCGGPAWRMAGNLCAAYHFLTDDGGQVYRYEAGPWVRLSDIAMPSPIRPTCQARPRRTDAGKRSPSSGSAPMARISNGGAWPTTRSPVPTASSTS